MLLRIAAPIGPERIVMILKEKNDRINLLVREHLVPNKELLALDPIIAGGSILFCYLLEKSCRQDFHWKLLMKKLGTVSGGRNLVKGATSGDFSDIDFWFAEDNDVHSSPELKWLVENYTDSTKGTPISTISSLGALPRLFSSLQAPISSGVTVVGANVGLSKVARSLGLSDLLKSTQWANTFAPGTAPSLRMKDVNHQFIKKPTKSVEALLSDFDFTNCMIAWKDDCLYYDSELMDLFNSGILKLNSDEQYISGSLPSKVFNALRAFKYGKRYGLDFDSALMKHIFDVYFECKSLDYEAYDKKIEYIKSTYGLERATSVTFKSMIQRLKEQFGLLLAMNSFKEEYALYLIDDEKELPGLKAYVDGLDAKA